MSKGHERRTADLENLEAEFREALAVARNEPRSAFLAEKLGQPRRGGATDLDVKLFTLESKIARIRELLELPVSELWKVAKKVPRVPPPAEPPKGWEEPPAMEGAQFPLDPRFLRRHLMDTGHDPDGLFSRVKCAGPRQRQSPSTSTWRLLIAECSDERVPSKAVLTVMPLPEGADALDAAEKLQEALERLVQWCERASLTTPRERPRKLTLSYDRTTRETHFSAR